ncbi:MAG: proline--tRNA ligase [Acidimicrobiia bacterium]|nr:proline--tRNA ligase [Acidimicrobiia bacterium]
MRMSRLFLRTLRDDPSDAEVDSHRLLVRGGFIRKVASGIYSWLPLGSRVLRRVERIVREEMDAAGAQELVLPIAQPLDLWERSGRDTAYGPLMFRLQDRKESWFCLSPTAEEVITSTVAAEYSSYRDLPVNLYQVNWKYRDELRPRFGLLRAREFLMKDAYSFDLDADGLQASYRAMYDAYHRIFERCGLTFRPVEGEAGEIGGDVNHEFMAVAAVGEDDFVWCRSCDYAANVEVARRRVDAPVGAASGTSAGAPDSERWDSSRRMASVSDPSAEDPAGVPAMEEVFTPGLTSIAEVTGFLGVEPSATLKSLAFEAGGRLGLALIPGDRELNEFALSRALAPTPVRLLDDADFAARPSLPRGFIGPHHPDVELVVADPSVAGRGEWVAGANRADHHVRHVVPGRDFRADRFAELVTIVTGDPCPSCGAELSVDRGIEVGQVFQLGTKYSEALGAHYTDEAGEKHPMVMGCYGIGVSRVVAAVVEEHHDEHGMAWPAAVAPFDVHLVAMPGEEPAAAAESLYHELRAEGVEVLLDDRDARAGVKFADADLIGVPVQLVVGAKGLARGVVERKVRATGERDELPLGEVVATVAAALGSAAQG